MTMLSLSAITTTAPNYLAGALTAFAVLILAGGLLILAMFLLGPVEP